MKNVQPFIDLGFFIVPLNGVITRNPKTEKKTIPPFPGPWKQLYLDTPYNPAEKDEEVAITGAVICGKKSGVISIDCDNQETYDMFKTLDPEYNFVFMSKGKKEGGGSIIYRLTSDYDDLPAFRIKQNLMQLDFQTNDLLQFLPTVGNQSKETWPANDLTDLPELRAPPPVVINYLKTLYTLQAKSKILITKDGNITQGALDKHYKHLAPFVESFLKSGKFAPELFRILTPAEDGFRDLTQYKREKTLHPDQVPEGLGNAYIKSVAGVLVCDSSVSPKLFKQMMLAVNAMWTKPYPKEKIENLIRYELNRERWVYDTEWQEKVNLILTDYNTLISVFYDPITRLYYCLDNKFGMSTFTTVDALPKHLNSIVQGGRKYTTTEIYDYLEKKQTMMDPLEAYGDLAPKDNTASLSRYNLFSRSEAYEILLKPENYHDKYREQVPKLTLAFFKHLIPDEITRDYVIRFVLTKLLTLKYSEVILYFLGMSGAGKNLFIDWLDKFLENTANQARNEEYKLVVEVDLENFLSKYNLWILNALFANLDEYGEKTSGVKEDRQVLAQMKSYSGKSSIQLRTMHTDPIPAYHKCTLILTANQNRLSPDLEDRRLVLIDTPIKLEHADFIKAYGGKSEAITQLFNEQLLWAYYWVTNYAPLTDNEYRTPPETEFKQNLIYRHLPASKKIAAILHDQNQEQLIELFEDNDMLQQLLDDAKYGAISKALLIKLFTTMVEGTSARKSMLDSSLRAMNIPVVKIRFGQCTLYAIAFISLKAWASKLQMNEGILLNRD